MCFIFPSLPPIKRGKEYSVYDTLSTGFTVEYDFDELLFDQNSPYQNVRILHSNQFGNCLILDNDISKFDISVKTIFTYIIYILYLFLLNLFFTTNSRLSCIFIVCSCIMHIYCFLIKLWHFSKQCICMLQVC